MMAEGKDLITQSYLKDINLPEPNFIGMAACKMDKFMITFKNYEIEVEKEDFGLLVIVYDFVMVLFYLIFVVHLEAAQKEYINEFKD